MIRALKILTLLSLFGSKVFAQAPQHIQMWNEVLTEASADYHSGDELGWSVSVGEAATAIGAPSHDFGTGATTSSNASSADYREDAGAVYLLEKFGSYWRNQSKVLAPDRQDYDLFGYSVSVSGTRCAVGAPGEDHDATGTGTSTTSQSGYMANSGSVYLFEYNGTSWTFSAKISAPVRESSDQFGSKVLLVGNQLFVAAPFEDHDGSESNSLANSGSVYAYNLVNGSWTLDQKIVANDRSAGDEFGTSIDFDGTTLAVGARFADVSSVSNQGAVYTFTKSGSWAQQSKITSSDGAAADFFGSSVAVFGTRLACGSPGNLGRGAVYVYQFASGAWGNEQKLLSSDIQSQDQFGEALSLFGDTLVVAAPGEDHDATGSSSSTSGQGYLSNAGSAYLFYRVSSGWSQSQKLILDNRGAQANFSWGVDINKNDLFIGSPYYQVSGVASGIAAFYGKDVYVWVGTTSSDPSTASNWKEGTLPPTDHDFLFTKGPFDPQFTTAIYANRITVLPNVNVSISAPNVIRADGSLYNDGSIRLLGSITGTYSSLFFRGSYSGSGTVFKEQYLGLGWHQIASPLQNNWSSALGANTASLVPFDASTGNYGGQGTMLNDEGRGFFAEVNGSSPYGGSAFMSNAGMLSIQGTPRTQATYQLGYSNNSNPLNVQHTSAVVDGWNLLGNPFTSPIDFRFLNRIDVDPYYSVWDPTLNGGLGGHKFWSYVGGSLSYIIPPMQGFWVRAWSGSSSISTIQMNQVGTITSVPRFLKKDDLKLRFINMSDSSFIDEVWITEVFGAQNDTFNHHLDVPKQFAPQGAVNAFLMVSGVAVSAKSATFVDDTIVFDIGLSRPLGNWVVKASGSRFSDYTWTLKGKSSSGAIQLEQDDVHQLPLNDSTFTLVGVRAELSTIEDSPWCFVRCAQGAIQIEPTELGTFDIRVFSTSGQLVAKSDGLRDTEVFVVPAPGVYIIKISSEHYPTSQSVRVLVL